MTRAGFSTSVMGIAARRRVGRRAAAIVTNADAGHGQAGLSAVDLENKLRDRKGKRRADGVFWPPSLWRRDGDGDDDNDGASSGGSAGVILDMSLVGDQTWSP